MNDLTHTGTLLNDVLVAGKTIMSRLDAALEPLGLSGAKLWTMQAIATRDAPVTVTALADCMVTTKSNVTAMLDRLEADGLATRQRSDEDRRAVHVALTPQGEALRQQAMGVFAQVNGDLCARLDATERNALLCGLRKMTSG